MEYTNRIQHIDVMKGILIIMVVAGHVCYALSTYSKIQLTNSAYSVYCDFINSFVAPYYMAAFFCVTGYCSNFSKPLWTQSKQDVRRLVIPAIIIPILLIPVTTPFDEIGSSVYDIFIKGSFPWFLMALFWSKLIIHLLLSYRIKNRERLVILTLLLFLGCFLLGRFSIFNYLSIFQGLAFAIFVYLGYLAKNKSIQIKWLLPSLLIYFISVVTLTLFHLTLPALCAIITFGLLLYPLFPIVALAGTIIIYFISRRIENNKLLEYLGRNTLVIYLTHYAFLILFSKTIGIYQIDINANVLLSVFIIMTMIAGVLLWSDMWIKLLNLRYTKWMIGK